MIKQSCQSVPFEKEGGGGGGGEAMTYKHARNEQQAMKTTAVHSGMFRASENCPTSGR